MNSHFTDEGCFDLVRRLLPPAQSESMQQHLQDGCQRCNELYNIWKTIAEVTGREVFYEPAEQAVRVAKAVYATRHRQYILPMRVLRSNQKSATGGGARDNTT